MDIPLQQDAPPRWRAVLEEQGRSLTWLAQRTGVSRAAVYAYSQRARRPQRAWFERVAEVLGVPVSLIVEEEAA